MPERDISELSQQEVFSYIDKEIKKDRKTFIHKILQKTKSNFTMVLVINLVAILIATVGFYTVYTSFQQRVYKLVGSSKSIKGLEDVFFQELQKQASAELFKTKQEMIKIQGQLEKLTGEMESFKAEQERKMQEQLAQKERELEAKMQAEMANKTAAEKELIKRKYEEQIQAEKKSMETAVKKEIQEYQKQLDNQKRQLLEQEKAQQDAIAKLQKEKEKAQKEWEAEKSKTAAELQKAELEIQKKEKIEAFNLQVNTMFQNAINAYKAGKYDLARSKLVSVTTLYANKPKDVPLSKEKERVDHFFVDALGDYLALKEMGASEGNIVNFEKMNQQATPNFDKAKNLFNSGNYEQALKEFQTVIAQYPGNKYTKDALNYIDKIYEKKIQQNQAESVIDINAIAKEHTSSSAGIYSSAKNYLSTGNYSAAQERYASLIKTYPLSDYLSKSVAGLIEASEAKIETKYKGKVDLNALIAQQTSDSKKDYQKASDYEKAGRLDEAYDKYVSIVNYYPLSEYLVESVAGIERIVMQKLTDKRITSDQLLASAKLEQTKSAKSDFNKAQTYEKSAKYDQAQDQYIKVITQYPLSDYLSRSIEGLTRVTGEIAKKSFNREQVLLSLKSDQNNLAKVEFGKAKTYENKGQLDKAQEKYIKIITEYPLSDYVSESITAIEQVVTAMSIKDKPQPDDIIKTLKKNQNIEANKLFAKASSSEKAGRFSDAQSQYAQLIIKYPLSDYVTESIYGISRAIEAQNKPSVILGEVKKNQNKEADKLFTEASKNKNAGKLTSAKNKLSSLIVKYPLSDYIDKSLAMLEVIIAEEERSKIPTVTDLTAIKKEQNTAAELLQKKALQSMKEGNFKMSEELYSQLILNYPFSDFIGDAVEGLKNSIRSTQTIPAKYVDIKEMKKEQNIAAKDIIARAEKELTKRRYENAKKLYTMLIIKYPLSDYVEQSITKLEETVLQLKIQEIEKAKVQQENYITKAVGRVVEVLMNEIILDIYQGKSLEVGQYIYIYRRDEKGGIVFIGEAKTIDVSPLMSKAKIINEEQKIRVGDIIFRK